MRLALLSLSLSILGAGFVLSYQAKRGEEIMWRKLDLAHDILDALVNEDFEALEAYGQDLETLGVAGEFFVNDTEEYRYHARRFRDAARSLTLAARDSNMDGATLAYVELTVTCVRCHQSLDVHTEQGAVFLPRSVPVP